MIVVLKIESTSQRVIVLWALTPLQMFKNVTIVRLYAVLASLVLLIVKLVVQTEFHLLLVIVHQVIIL